MTTDEHRRQPSGQQIYTLMLASLSAGVEPETVAAELEDQSELLAAERLRRGDSQRQIRDIWSIALERFELLLSVATGLVVAWAREVDAPAKVGDGDARCEAVLRLARRGVNSAHEVLWMLEGGYPSAAMARWRTMHEMATFALALSHQPPILSRRFLDHQWIEAHRRIAAMPDGMRQADPDMPAYEEHVRLQAVRVQTMHPDKAFTRMNGWMAPIVPSCRFGDLQKHVGTELAQLVYLLGNAHTHAGHVEPAVELGTPPGWGDVQIIGSTAVDLDQVGVYAPHTLAAFPSALLRVEMIQNGSESIAAIECLRYATSVAFAQIGEVISQTDSGRPQT
jgi:hypothetical protein